MPPRFSIWMVLAGVVVGVLAGYVAGRGWLGAGPLAKRKEPALITVREEFAKGVAAGQRGEMLRAFDEAVRKARRR